MNDAGLKRIGSGIAFAALVIAATILEVNGKEAGGLWVLAVIWAVAAFF